MKITHLEAWSVTMRLKEPYTIAYETYETATNVFIRVETDTGIIGFGCASPDEHVTGETPDVVKQDFDTTIFPVITGRDPLCFAGMLKDVKAAVPHHPSAVAALDMALYDILGKVSGLPVWKLIGGYRDSMITTITIGIMPEDETIRRAKEYIKQGFKAIKLKGGLNAESDIARVLKVRETVGDEIELRFDANQGYTVEETVHFIKQTERARLELIEQPTPQEKPELLKKITQLSSVPIMADESLLTLDDAFYIASNKLADMLNIKLTKVGGIFEAAHINAVAHAAHLKVMVGCMDEPALGIAAGLHFALSHPNIGYADLDGHFDLIGDPTEGAVIFRDGMLFPSDNPGLGIDAIF